MIYSIIICAIFFVVAALWLIRFITEAGLKLPGNRFISFATTDKIRPHSEEKTTRREYIYIFLGAVIFRIAVFLLGFIAYRIFNNNICSLAEYLNKWNLWDSPHYIDIAAKGYSGNIEDGKYLFLVFFPLYPFLIKMFHFIIPNYVVSGLLVSTLCYSVGCVLTYKLVSIDYSKSIALKSVMFLSISPFTFFFGGIMTESLFFVTIIATFLAIRKHKWLAAGILGMFAALSRSFGALMIIPAFVEWAQTERPIQLIREKHFKELLESILKMLPIFIMIVGILIYLVINYHNAGDPFIFLKYQKEHWHQELQFFGKTLNLIYECAVNPTKYPSLNCTVFIPGMIIIALMSIVMLYGTRRTRSMYTIFMLIYFAYNSGATWPLSICRYLSCMFPVYWIVAEFTDRHKWLEMPLTAIMAIAFGIYLTGYITMHQIM